MSDLPGLYFRLRDIGATVYRVDAANRQRRLELVQIATANLRNDQIRAHADRPPTPEEEAGIRAWMEGRRALLAARSREAPEHTIEALNDTAHWAQTRATDAELEAVADRLLLAMHDLRGVLVRRKAAALPRSPAPPTAD